MAAPGPSQPGGTQDDKQLGGKIRGLKNRAHHDKHTLVSMEDNKIVSILQEANEYVTQVTRPRDVAADAELFNFLAESAQEYVHKLKQGGRAHSSADLLRRLKTRFVEGLDVEEDDPFAFDWAKLGQGRSVALLFRSVPATHHMLGPLDAQPRQRRAIQRQAKRKAPVGPAARPEELTSLEDGEKQETDRNMEAMWHLLKDVGGRARLLDLVLNPVSFAQTVENLFALSFLVRDGRVALERDDELGIMVQQRHITKAADAKEKSRDEDKTQFVIRLTLDIWEAWKQAVGDDFAPMMKHRKDWRERHQEQAQAQQQQQQAQQQQQQQQQEEGGEEEEEEEEEARPRQQKRQRQARGKAAQREQQLQQQEEEEEGEQQEEPRSARRKSRSKTPQPASAKRQQQQEQQPPKQQQQQQQQQAPAANGGVEVISIDDSDVIDLLDSDDDAGPAVTGRRAPTPLQQVQVKQEQPTQGKRGQPSQAGGSQRPSQRGPMRGRR